MSYTTGVSKMDESIIKEILGVTSTEPTVEVDEIVIEPTTLDEAPLKLVAEPREVYDDDTGATLQRVPFKDVFGWTPHIDHLVATYEGYDTPPPMAGYVVDKAMVESFSLCESVGLKQNITGPTGCGKTQLVEWYAAMTGRPYMRVPHTEAFDRAEVFGQVHITAGETDFVMGVIPRTFIGPYLVLLDELTRAPAYALMAYGTLMDRRELILAEMKEGGIEPLKPSPGWSVCAADNTKGNGDGMDKYIASNVQDSAFLNRFDVVHETDYLSPKLEETMIENLFPAGFDARKLAMLSSMLHTGSKDGTLSVDFSPRNLQALAKLVTAGMPLHKAFQINYMNRVTECELQDVQETFRAIYG